MLTYKRGIGWVEDDPTAPVAVVKLYNGNTVKAYDRQPEHGESFTNREKIETVDKLVEHLKKCSFDRGGLRFPGFPALGVINAWALEVFDPDGNKY